MYIDELRLNVYDMNSDVKNYLELSSSSINGNPKTYATNNTTIGNTIINY